MKTTINKKPVIVFGYADDVIVIMNTEYKERIHSMHQSHNGIILFSDGTIIRICYNYDWSFKVIHKGYAPQKTLQKMIDGRNRNTFQITGADVVMHFFIDEDLPDATIVTGFQALLNAHTINVQKAC